MSITIGDPAPNSTWQIAWQNGAVVTDGSTISLSSCLGKVVALIISKAESG